MQIGFNAAAAWFELDNMHRLRDGVLSKLA